MDLPRSPPENVRTGPRLRHELIVTWIYLAIMAGSALPTPLYPLYRQRLGLPAVGITIVYGFYAIVVLVTLLWLGFLSDRIGRRPVLFLAVVATAASELVLLVTPTLIGLYVSRGLIAIGVGLAIAALPAYLTDLAGPEHMARATLFGVAANMGGQALGTFLAGTVSGMVSHPLAAPYLAGLILLGPVALMLFPGAPETVSKFRPDEPGRPREKRIPPQLLPDYRATAITIVAAFAMFGFLTAMTGQILQQRMAIPGAATAGLVTAALFVSGAVGQMLAGRLASARNPAVTVIPLPVSAILLVAATLLGSLVVFAVAVIVCGFGGGICLRSGSTRVLALSPVENRAHVSSRLFAALYLGACVPTISAGLLATTMNLNVSMIGLGSLVCTLSVAAAVLLRKLPDVHLALATTDVLSLADLDRHWPAEATVQFFVPSAARTVLLPQLTEHEFPLFNGRLSKNG